MHRYESLNMFGKCKVFDGTKSEEEVLVEASWWGEGMGGQQGRHLLF